MSWPEPRKTHHSTSKSDFIRSCGRYRRVSVQKPEVCGWPQCLPSPLPNLLHELRDDGSSYCRRDWWPTLETWWYQKSCSSNVLCYNHLRDIYGSGPCHQPAGRLARERCVQWSALSQHELEAIYPLSLNLTERPASSWLDHDSHEKASFLTIISILPH